MDVLEYKKTLQLRSLIKNTTVYPDKRNNQSLMIIMILYEFGASDNKGENPDFLP